jgi:hypothetical protein
MKCVKSPINNEIRRVRDDIATELVETKKFTFCGKEEWKKQTRPETWKNTEVINPEKAKYSKKHKY